jgi:peptidyl-prolyl cis-trans isomerase B (cyclophilin B)
MIRFHTNKGAIDIELNEELAPVSCRNFLEYVDSGHFEDTIFHRVIPSFMVQGGGFTVDMKQKSTGAPIENEADNGLKNDTGTVAMARTGDPHSATCQFFINVNDNDFLNHSGKNPQGWGYCVFGKVVSDMDMVIGMSTVPTTTSGPYSDVPVEPLVIERVEKIDASN